MGIVVSGQSNSEDENIHRMLRERILQLMHGESDSVSVQACRLMYQLMRDQKEQAESDPLNRPLRVVFGAPETVVPSDN